VRIAVADDDPLVLAALAALVGARRDCELVARCTDGRQLLDATSRLHPDAVIVDVGMPDSDVPLMQLLARIEPLPLIVAISGHPTSVIRRRLLAAGADAVLQKAVDDPLAFVVERVTHPRPGTGP